MKLSGHYLNDNKCIIGLSITGITGSDSVEQFIPIRAQFGSSSSSALRLLFVLQVVVIFLDWNQERSKGE